MFRLHKILLFLSLVVVIVASLPPQLRAQTQNQAAVIVRAGDGEGDVHTSCVEFTEEQITGFEALLRSGLDIETDAQGIGALVCNIDGTGCPANDCLCQCQGGGDCTYWSYWHQLEGSWQFSQAGASLYPVTDGAVEGWSWGPGAVNEAIPPPDYTFEMVCQAEVTNTPTTTNTPTPTNTPAPTDKVVPAETHVPTGTPLPKPTNTPVLPTQTPSPSHTPLSQPPGINFWADVGMIDAGSCTTLRWEVTNSTAVLLSGREVSQRGVREVCPEQSETYTLNIIHPGGEEQRSLTVNVLTTTASPVPTTTPQALAAAPALSTAAESPMAPSPTNTPLPTKAIATESSNSPPTQEPTGTTVSIAALPSPSATATRPATLAAALLPATTLTPLSGNSTADTAPKTGFPVLPFALLALLFILFLVLGFALVKRVLST